MRSYRATAAGLFPAAVFALAAACGQTSIRAADTAATYPPGYIVDSIHPPEEALRRFRLRLHPVTALDGPASRDELLSRFSRAAAAGDSAALRALAINVAEFAFLVYPESKLSRPPYRQPPEISWLTLQLASNSGFNRLVNRAGTMELLGHSCPDSVQVEGRMRTISGCTMRVRMGGAIRDMRLFGRIVKLDGRWKIVGFDGDL